MKLIFDTNGNEKQKEVCRYWANSDVSDIVYGGSKGSGKSYLGCSLIFGDALTYPETQYFIARKKLNDLRKFTIPSIHEVFGHWGIGREYYTYNGQDNQFNLYNGSTVFLIEAKLMPSDPLFQRFGSMQMTRGWIEEAGEFETAAKNNLAASIGRWKNDIYDIPGKLLQTCNPSKNYLYRDYYKKNKENSLEVWKRFVQALPQDNKKLPIGYIENLIRSLSANEKERLLYGNWEFDDDPATMIIYDKIVDLFTNSFVVTGEKYIIADIARMGRDYTRIGRFDGRILKEVKSYPKNLVTDAAIRIKEMSTEHSIPMSNVLVDEDGVGGGVKDILECKGFVNNSRALNGENYDNLKSQCAFKFAEKVNKSGYYIQAKLTTIEKDEIIQELEQLKAKNIDIDSKKGIVSKDKIKELIGRSPDWLDMLIMREWFDLIPEQSHILLMKGV